MDRGIPGKHLSAPAQDVETNPVPTRRRAMDSDGLPLATTSAAEDSGLLESKRLDFEPRREEEGFLLDAAVVSRPGPTAEMSFRHDLHVHPVNVDPFSPAAVACSS